MQLTISKTQAERETEVLKNKGELDKDKAVEMAIGQIEKQFGRGSIMWLGDDSIKVKTEIMLLVSEESHVDVSLNFLARSHLAKPHLP